MVSFVGSNYFDLTDKTRSNKITTKVKHTNSMQRSSTVTRTNTMTNAGGSD